MNTLDAGLSAYDVLGMTAVVSSLLADADLGVSVVYTSMSGARAYNPGSGTVSYGDTGTTFTGYLSPLDLRQVDRIDGAQLGDVQLLVRFADLAEAPAKGDRFVVGTTTHSVYRVVRGPLSSHWAVYARSV